LAMILSMAVLALLTTGAPLLSFVFDGSREID